MSLPKEQLDIIRAEAAAVVKAICRAEAKAQAVLKCKELADKFNEIHDQDWSESQNHHAETATLRAEVGRLQVLTDVLIDVLVDARALNAVSMPEDKRAMFYQLCDAKRQKLAAMQSNVH